MATLTSELAFSHCTSRSRILASAGRMFDLSKSKCTPPSRVTGSNPPSSGAFSRGPLVVETPGCIGAGQPGPAANARHVATVKLVSRCLGLMCMASFGERVGPRGLPLRHWRCQAINRPDLGLQRDFREPSPGRNARAGSFFRPHRGRQPDNGAAVLGPARIDRLVAYGSLAAIEDDT